LAELRTIEKEAAVLVVARNLAMHASGIFVK
jgi:hypothetical protein